MNGDSGGVVATYDAHAGTVFVIGGDGIILYRNAYDDAALRTIIDEGLAALVSSVPDIGLLEHSFEGGYPNPFNPSTRLVFSLAPGTAPSHAKLDIVDLQGRLLRVLLDETATPDHRYEAVWNGRDLTGRAVASGVYLARLRVGNWQATRALTLVK